MNFFLRALIAVICVVGFNWIMPAVMRLIGFPVSGDMDIVIKGVVAVCALLYIVFGPTVKNPFA